MTDLIIPEIETLLHEPARLRLLALTLPTLRISACGLYASLAVTQEMLDAPNVTVVMVGGTLRRDTASLVGPDGLGVLGKYNIQKGFFGAHGISLLEGLTDVSAEEADVKRPLVAACRQVVAVQNNLLNLGNATGHPSRIMDGSFAEGEAVPSVRQVASDYQINHLTVGKAYQELVDAVSAMS